MLKSPTAPPGGKKLTGNVLFNIQAKTLLSQENDR